MQGLTGAILATQLHSTNAIPKLYAIIVVLLICVFVSGFAWSWGPLGWLIPSEIFPLETRTSGFFFAVSMNMICTFIIAQAFLTMLCHMRSGIFFFFVAWIVVMGSFAAFLLPETGKLRLVLFLTCIKLINHGITLSFEARFSTPSISPSFANAWYL